ncbi:uncharacterized protein BCR38DRAFT_486543 [Pseudomassariella vexata]|uniref:Uncharacterized protein n=1 Tax=Pseudomassariella vexata TaxID=1141098 RepID=A0A1Y2DSP2_9PEZI|nr:uncharacterized protein BCR38DRAFT_486543 [Pseudomassariella vexata]ORY62270.1 hypothetical protein BCR38DRAFT_486543 [Pseudomassariella vexata]
MDLLDEMFLVKQGEYGSFAVREREKKKNMVTVRSGERTQTSFMQRNKSTWFGCGKHIPSVLDQLPVENWCTCEPKFEVDGKKYPPKVKQ